MIKVNKINFFDEIAILGNKLNLKPTYLSRQLNDWVIKKKVTNPEKMSNISRTNQEKLLTNINFQSIFIQKKQLSQKSQTKKYLFKTQDHHFFESVLIEDKNQNYTLCLSSQIGCSLHCDFCATGTMKLRRNLSAGEIVEQYYWLNQEVNDKIKNIVFMGMGEPFLNTKNLFQAVHILYHYFAFPASRISISTSGIIKGIEKLITFPIKANLCLSLHSAIQSTRDKIMPDLIRLPLPDLKKVLLDYMSKTGKEILIEYIMLQGINDDEKHLKALASFLNGLKVKINLIAYNKVAGKKLSPSLPATIKYFNHYLQKRNYLTFQRYKKGDDIDAACGQLALAK